jgi:hypothetical protein
MQEWLQPEGNRITKMPLLTLKHLLEKKPDLSIIVKEVGQGMGYESLKALMQLPIKAIEFGAFGGTNFAQVELLRTDEQTLHAYKPFAYIGHSANEMVDYANAILEELGDLVLCDQFILSGGIDSFLDGYYLMQKIKANAIYGKAQAFLTHARGDYDALYRYIDMELKGLFMAQAFLRVKAHKKITPFFFYFDQAIIFQNLMSERHLKRRGDDKMAGKTLYEKIWDKHLVHSDDEGNSILYIDLHLVHEVTSPQAFEGLRMANRKVRRPDLTFATMDHNVPTKGRYQVEDLISKQQMETLSSNCAQFGIQLFDLNSQDQGIVHVIGPELGLTPTRKNHCMRRQSYFNPWCIRRPCLWHRHQ